MNICVNCSAQCLLNVLLQQNFVICQSTIKHDILLTIQAVWSEKNASFIVVLFKESF